jgi:hypothetical protein
VEMLFTAIPKWSTLNMLLSKTLDQFFHQ